MSLISNNKKFFDLILILIIPIFFSFIINFIFKVNFHHDSLLMYLNFKFLYNYYQTYSSFPEWIDYIYYGQDASVLYLYDVSKIFFPSIILGTNLNLNSYFIYLINLSLLNSIFLFGIYKNINEFRFKFYVLAIISIIFLSFTFLHKAFSANFEVFLLFPFIFYYLNKFIVNRKISEINKILIIIFISYVNSIQYFSIFFIYFTGIFIVIYLLFNFKFSVKVKFKKKYIFFYLIWFLISLIYFTYIENVIQENYLLPNRSNNLDVNNSFTFALHGYHNILIKFLTSISNFFWWDVPLTISLIGVFFNSLFFFSSKINENKNIKISLFIFILFIILLSETIIFYDFVKLFFHLPFLGFFRHFSFVIIYLKPLLIITAIFGLINYFKLIEKKEFNYLFKFKLKFILYLSLSFFFVFGLLSIINDQLNLLINSNNEDLFFNSLFSHFKDKLQFLGIENRANDLDLFRGLKFKILNSFLINLFSLTFIFLIMFFIINKRKYNYFIITNLIILSLIPGFIFNYSNYSMSEKINIFSNDKNLIKLIQREYNENIISDKNFKKFNNVKNCTNNNSNFFNEISNIIPKFSILYENINIFLRKKNCKPRYRNDFLSKNYTDMNLSYLHFDKDTKYEKINNENYIIYNPRNEIVSNINFSTKWIAVGNISNPRILNDNGKIKILFESSDKLKKINLIYKNKIIQVFAYLNILIGAFLYFLFIKSLFSVFSAK